jgi:hypothetical protein
MAGPMILINCCFNTGLVLIETFAVILQIRSYSTIAREIKSLDESNKRAEERKQRRLSRGADTQLEEEGGEPDKDLPLPSARSMVSLGRLSVYHGKDALQGLKEILPPPTEDEVHFIKSRTEFAKFEVRWVPNI